MTADIVKKSSRGRTPTGEPNPIDVHVGNRIRLRRTLLGLSQEGPLAAAIIAAGDTPLTRYQYTQGTASLLPRTGGVRPATE